jgi:succinoglycan biosynthesis transport protein ExoP
MEPRTDQRVEQRVDWTTPEGSEAAQGAGVNPLWVFWRQKWLILLMTAVGSGLGYLYFLQCPPVYQSSSQVLIVRNETRLPVQGVDAQRTPDDSLSMHSVLMKSPTVVSRAVEKHQLAKLPSYHGVADPTGAIIASLTATTAASAAGSSNVVGLTFKGGDPADCAKVLSAILDSYKEFLGNAYQDRTQETADLIKQAKDVLLKQLSEKEEAYRKFRQEAPLLWKGSEGSNLHEERMAKIEAARADAIVQVSQTKSRMTAIKNALAKEGNRGAVALLIGNLSAIPDGSGSAAGNSANRLAPRNSFEDNLFSVFLEEQLLLEEYGPDHPKVKAARKRMNLIKSHLANAMPNSVEGASPDDFINVYLESLAQEIKLHEQRLEGLNALFETERNSAKALATYQVQDETFRNEISRTQQLFGAVVKRLDEINLIKDYTGINVQVISPPGPGVQIAPKFTQIMAIAAFCGMLAGFGLGYCIELMDRRFRSPEEVRQYLGLPIFGHVPMIGTRKGKRIVAQAAEGSPLAPTLCVAHQPKGRQAEAYRAVRTALYFSTHAEGHKVIQITSPNPGDGKTTTAANLALSIAGSGKRVVLVDADFRRPKIHKLLGLDNDIGLSSAISGDAELPDAVRPTAAENLWAITSGPRPANPAELLTSVRFKELIDVLRDQYDYVVIDSPPVLAVTDPSAIAPRVDAVLLVLRLTKNARATSRHATETLASLGANILGVIVNGVGQQGRYGYGRYGYGYGYAGYKYGYRGYGYGYGYGGHGYGYGYGYGRYGYEESDKVYYEEKTEETASGNGASSNGKSAAKSRSKQSK